MKPLAATTNRRAGFTLVELVVVIVTVGIIAAMAATFISQPVEGYLETTRRAALVDAAESALRRVARDVRQALPNSIRIRQNGGDQVLEMINTVEGVRYRDDPPPGNRDEWLEFNRDDAQFNILGQFRQVSDFTDKRLVVYHTGDPGANAYNGDAVITPAGVTINRTTHNNPPNGPEDHLTLSSAHRFPHRSPEQRLFVIDTPISYECLPNGANPAAGVIRRYWGYQLSPAQPGAGNGFAGNPDNALLVHKVADCELIYQPGTSERSGLVTLRITLAEAGEQVSLLHQIHISNAP